MNRVVLYSASWCKACDAFKKCMTDAGIAFDVRMLDDEAIVLEANGLGIKNLPAVVVDGEQLITCPTVYNVLLALGVE